MRRTLGEAGWVIQWSVLIVGYAVLGYTVGAVLWFFITLK